MSVLTVTRMVSGLGWVLRKFVRAERGSVTLQMLFMSIALMGTTGLVLDSGRLYSKHTQMQAFTDQMALAAAAELDGKSDSIDRARAAVEGLDGNSYLSKFDSQGNEFGVRWMGFYTDVPAGFETTTGQQNDITDIIEYLIEDETDPDSQREARYVAVVAVQWRVGNLVGPLSRMISAPDNCNGGPCAPSQIPDKTDVQTVAVATLERVTCADLSTLVFCNPWEDRPGNEFDDQGDLTGRTIRYFAPNFDRIGAPPQRVATGFSQGSVGSPWPYDERNQLHLMVDPVADPGGFCGLLFVLGFTASGDDEADLISPDYLAARDQCLLGRARAETVCFEEEIGIRPARGETVLKGINLAFDHWMPPFDELLLAGTGDVVVPNTGIPLAAYFEPDQTIVSRWWTYGNNGDAYSPWTGEYELIPEPGYTLRGGFNPRYDRCHVDSYRALTGGGGAPCSLPLVSDDSTIPSSQRSQYYTVFKDHVFDPVPPEITSFETWYELYQAVREAGLTDSDENISEVKPNQATLNGHGRTSDDPTGEIGDPGRYFDEIANGMGGYIMAGYERRRIRSAMVNCGAMYDNDNLRYQDDPTPDDEFHTGTIEYWLTPIEAIVDVHLPEPAGMHCGVGVFDCTIADSIETSLMIELIDEVDDAFMQRYAVTLVR